ncbi:MAG: DUF3472 domain-containing protein [Bacteroidetes bacterium]|nr:DUF3472 domain-containing protein [Bacteroidota bacterium]
MRYTIIRFFAAFCLFLFSHCGYADIPSLVSDSILRVPIGGNTWVYNAPAGKKLITKQGIKNWDDTSTYFKTYIRFSKTGTLFLKIKAKSEAICKLSISIGKKWHECKVKNSEYRLYDAGKWDITDTGYVAITLRGVQKSGINFADISDFEISGTVTEGAMAYTPNDEGNFFYWGRRGPSVHLNYPFDDTVKTNWFYNEVTVPKGNDIVGSYFMAIGFGEGYFGMQVNSNTERRILFSVWSPFSTDDPKKIPDDMRIKLLKKGTSVQSGEFGNEGSGGQSFLRYNWKPGITYKFLLHGQPGADSSTVYTAYFFAPERATWELVASFKRPHTHTYLKRFHSFLENFIPEQGDKTREVFFGNQWIHDKGGNWISLKKAIFTYDNTAARGYRMDFTGGIMGDRFYLRNCGFFNNYTMYKSAFERLSEGKIPEINLEDLP